MSNVLLAWPNRIDTASISGGAWTPTLPLTNLQDRVLAHAARTQDADPATTRFMMSLDRDRRIGLVALVAHNLSLAARWRVTGAYSGGAAVYDSGWLAAWPAFYDSANLEWEADNWWSGQPAADELSRITRVAWLRPDAVAQDWSVEIDDAGNEAGFVEIGRGFIGEAWQPTHNASYGWQFGHEADTDVERAYGGDEYFDVRPSRRTFDFSLDWLTDGEAAKAFDLQREVGVSGEMFVVHNPADAQNLMRRAFFGRMERLSPLAHPYFSVHSAAFRLKEIL